MSNMELGTYVFDWNPDRWTIPKEEKFCGRVLTYSSVGFFSFGVSIIGKEILLEWDWMPVAQFNTLNVLFISDLGYPWDPKDGYIYDVEILSFNGAYFETTALDTPYRKNVKMVLMILS
jgi:hypothetical protein